MNDFEFSKSLVRLDELINERLYEEAELLYERIKNKLDTFSDEERFTRLEGFWDKIAEGRDVKKYETVSLSISGLIESLKKEQGKQLDVMIDIRWYLKFFFWLAVIGLILMLISILL